MSMPECRRFFPVRRRSNLSCKCDACSAVTHAFEMREDGYNVLGSISPGDMIRSLSIRNSPARTSSASLSLDLGVGRPPGRRGCKLVCSAAMGAGVQLPGGREEAGHRAARWWCSRGQEFAGDLTQPSPNTFGLAFQGRWHRDVTEVRWRSEYAIGPTFHTQKSVRHVGEPRPFQVQLLHEDPCRAGEMLLRILPYSRGS